MFNEYFGEKIGINLWFALEKDSVLEFFSRYILWKIYTLTKLVWKSQYMQRFPSEAVTWLPSMQIVINAIP